MVLEKCSSTNDVALNSALKGAPHGFTVIAEEQTEGRGRQGRVWTSPRGGIWMTVIFRPPVFFEPLNALPLLGALAVVRTITLTLKTRALIRWPNDVLVNYRKLAGVLVEARFTGDALEFALLGIGINANFPASLIRGVNEKSTSLVDILGYPVDRVAVVCSLLQETEGLYDRVTSGKVDDVLKLVRQSECSLGKYVKVRVADATFTGVVDEYAGLSKVRIRTAQGSYLVVETGTVLSVDYLDV